MADLTGVKAVVTGATSGLGAAMTDALLRAGAAVAMAARPTPRLEEAVATHHTQDMAAEALPLDVRDPVSVSAASASSSGHCTAAAAYRPAVLSYPRLRPRWPLMIEAA